MNRIEQTIDADPGLAREFRVFLKNTPQFKEEELFEKVDESDYSLRDWAEALVVFDRWLTVERARERPFTAMLGYIHCCTMANTPQIGLASLKVIVDQSLTEYGFEEVSKNQI